MTPPAPAAKVPARAAAKARPVAGPVLVIEDMSALQLAYRAVLTEAGYRVLSAGSAGEGLALFQRERLAVVVLDLLLPDRNGLDLMREILEVRPDTAVIVITANASIAKAVEAMRAGAHEFLLKPFDQQQFLDAVANAAGPRAATARRPTPPVPTPPLPTGTGRGDAFIGSSAAMDRIHAKIRSVARSMATVFITGESGTGKELCALAVHDNSARGRGPFIALNCGAIPHELLESEVFGHMKGSFTGAVSDKPGAAAAADGGTLFLDEVCEMAPALQTKLLRFLQTSTVQPVGATRPRKVNVRIICATNRDPLESVRRGQFREDLYYRLYVVPIHMPPLRERGSDVIEIAEAALRRFGAEEGRHFDGLAPDVRELFLRLPWPGNVRQVLNVIRNVVVLNEGGVVTPEMLPDDLAHAADPVPPQLVNIEPSPPQLEALVGLTLAEIEHRVIEATLAHHGGSVPRAARALDVSPSTLYRKLASWQQG